VKVDFQNAPQRSQKTEFFNTIADMHTFVVLLPRVPEGHEDDDKLADNPDEISPEFQIALGQLRYSGNSA